MSIWSDPSLDGFYQGRILNIAHRGARERAPENTLPAFAVAADMGADGIEFDVQLSADGEAVIIHDATVDRTTDGSGQVAAKSLAELRALDAGCTFSREFAGTRIPTLAEVLDALRDRVVFNVELKPAPGSGYQSRTRLAQTVVAAVQFAQLAGRVLCSSFDPLILRAVRRLAPAMALGYLHAPDQPLPLARGWLARPVIGRHQARHPHFSMVNRPYMRWARRHHYRVNVWTVNEVDDIRRMRDLGVDAIISDRPDVVQDVLQGEL